MLFRSKEIREKYSKEEDFFEIRYNIRLEKLSKLFDEFEAYVNDEIKEALPKSPLGKALEYTHKLLPGMRVVLENGAIEIDNNSAELSIKPFVIGRKNWMFSNTGKGARSSATLYSIIETAKSHGLVAEKYLVYIMGKLSVSDTPLSKEELLRVMPWSNELPEDLRIPIK